MRRKVCEMLFADGNTDCHEASPCRAARRHGHRQPTDPRGASSRPPTSPAQAHESRAAVARRSESRRGREEVLSHVMLAMGTGCSPPAGRCRAHRPIVREENLPLPRRTGKWSLVVELCSCGPAASRAGAANAVATTRASTAMEQRSAAAVPKFDRPRSLCFSCTT